MECMVDGCAKSRKVGGFCSMHYARLHRHGDLNADLKRSDNYDVLCALIQNPSENCIEWTRKFNHEGYPLMRKDSKTHRVNRIVCGMHHGQPPTAEHHAAHSCGNRACVNPLHIRWATPQENISDKCKHGTTARGENVGTAILTESQVIAIKQRLHSGEGQSQIATKFGVSSCAIHKIAAGKNWGWLDA